MSRKPRGRDKGVDFGEKSGHAKVMARYSVHVNARDNVSARTPATWQFPSMKKGWDSRLREVIGADGRSPNELSVAAGLGRNYVQQYLKDNKSPGSERLARLLDVLGQEAAIYVYTGMRIRPEDAELLQRMSHLDDESRLHALALFESLLRRQEPPAS